MDQEALKIEIQKVVKKVVTEYLNYYTGLEKESDRGAAILAASHFEKSLEDAIASRFVALDSESRNTLFGERGPLFPFGAKINLALALGLCSKEVSEEWHQIRRIRNEFAHASSPIDFEEKNIKTRVENLTQENVKADVTPRQKYINYLINTEGELAQNQTTYLAQRLRSHDTSK